MLISVLRNAKSNSISLEKAVLNNLKLNDNIVIKKADKDDQIVIRNTKNGLPAEKKYVTMNHMTNKIFFCFKYIDT